MLTTASLIIDSYGEITKVSDLVSDNRKLSEAMRVIPQPGQPLHSLTVIVLLRNDVAMGQCSVEDRFCGGALVAGVKGN